MSGSSFLAALPTHCPLLEGGRTPGSPAGRRPSLPTAHPPQPQSLGRAPIVKRTHTLAFPDFTSNLLKTTGLRGLSGWQRPDLGVSLNPRPDTEAHGHHPPSSWRVGKESERTHTHHGEPRVGGRVKRQVNASLLRPREADVGEGAWSLMHPSSSNAASQDSN